MKTTAKLKNGGTTPLPIKYAFSTATDTIARLLDTQAMVNTAKLAENAV